METIIFDDISIVKGDDIECIKYRMQEIRKNILIKKFEKRFSGEVELSPQRKAIFDYAVNYANKWEMYQKGEYNPTPIEMDQFEHKGLKMRLYENGKIIKVEGVGKLSPEQLKELIVNSTREIKEDIKKKWDIVDRRLAMKNKHKRTLDN